MFEYIERREETKEMLSSDAIIGNMKSGFGAAGDDDDVVLFSFVME